MSEPFNLPPWSNEDALKIGIVEDVQSPRSETIRTDGFDTTINFLCPWNRRFAAYNYIWGHTAPIVGARSMLFNGSENPVNLMDFSIKNNTPPILDNNVDLWKLFWKPLATQVQISAYSEPGSPANPNITPNDVLNDSYVFSDGGLGHDDYAECSYVRHTLAKMTVTYTALAKCTHWTVGCTVTPVIEGRTLSPYHFRWKHDGSPLEEDQAPMDMESMLTLDLSFTNCTDVPEWLWLYNGTVNGHDGGVTLDWGSKFKMTFPKGTLMFTVKSLANKRTYARNDLDDMWDVTLCFVHDRLGFNKYRRSSSLIGNVFSDEIIDMLGRTVKNYEEVEWKDKFLDDLLLKETS